MIHSYDTGDRLYINWDGKSYVQIVYIDDRNRYHVRRIKDGKVSTIETDLKILTHNEFIAVIVT